MKIATRDIEAQVRRLSPSYVAVLLYGPDEGLVRERAEKIARQIVEDLTDPFLVANLDPADLKSEPARLADEVAAISMMGGRRVIRVDGAAENVTAAVGALLDDPKGDGLVVVTAGNLRPASNLRKLFEKAKNAATLPCYEDNRAALENLILDVMRENGLSLDPDAMNFLQANLGSDRMVSRGELQKLALYMVKADDRTVRLEDVQACVGDSGSLTLDMISAATLGGDLRGLDSSLFKAFNRGENPIPILRGVARRLQRLHLARGFMEQGMSVDQAMGKLVPRVFAMETRSFKAELHKWTTGRLGGAMDIVATAERECKTTGMPVQAICARACLRIANAARG